jgi:hypothetical protein
MIREIIVTSPQGVRLAFQASGEEGLEVQRHSPVAMFVDICDRSKPIGEGKFAIIGMVPTSWLIELNENVT